MTERLEIRAFGGLTLRYGGQVVTGLPSREMEALLLYLSLTHHQHAREHLAELFFGEDEIEAALGNLRVLLTRLRKVFPDHLLTTRQTVGIAPDVESWSDAGALQQTLEPILSGIRGMASPARAMPLLPGEVTRIESVLPLYAGSFLQNIALRGCPAFDEWVSDQRAKFEQLFIEANRKLLELYREQNGVEAALRAVQRLLQVDPLREEFYRDQMELYWRAGQPERALETWELLRARMNAELGVAPEAETRRLAEQISQSPQAAVNSVSPTAKRLQVPSESTAFIGRKHERIEIAARLHDAECRLLTLLGMGGIGKTRLAMAVARQPDMDSVLFPDGIFFVPFENVWNAALVPATIGAALRIGNLALETPAQIKQYLAEKRVLLILDNMENVLEGVPFLSELIDAARHLKLLVTSRERLYLREEWIFDVEGLAYPTQTEEPAAFDNSDAVQLLVTRTRQVGVSLFLNRQRALIARLCAAIQGMPLALEMVAALLREVSLDDLTTQLEQSFDPLQSPLRNIPERQRNLRILFDQSWRYLSNTERRILAQLSSFAGSISEAAAQAITGATPEHLERLAAKSMLQAQGNGRYSLHPVIRQYAFEQLENPAATQEKHAYWFKQFAHNYDHRLHTLEFRAACDAIEPENENLHAALRWLGKHQRFEDVIMLLHPLAQWFVLMERNATGIALLTEVRGLITPSGLPNAEYRQSVGWLLNYNIRFLLQQRLYKEAETLVTQSLSLYDALTADPYLQMCLCNNYATFYLITKQDYANAERYAHLAIDLARQHSYSDEQGKALHTLATLQSGLGHYEQAHEALAECLQLEVKDPLTLASVLHQQGMVEFKRGRYEDSLRYFEQVLEFDRKYQFDSHYARTLMIYGSAFIGTNRFAEAEQALLQSIAFFQMAGHRVMVAANLSQLGDVELKTGRAEAGIAHYEECARIMQEMSQFYGLAATYANVAFTILDALLVDLYPKALEYALASVEIARTHQFDAHLDNALGIAGKLQLQLGDFGSARSYLIEALEIALRIKSYVLACDHLCGLANYLRNVGNPEFARRICETILAHPAITEVTIDATRSILKQMESAQNTGTVDEEISQLFARFIALSSVLLAS